MLMTVTCVRQRLTGSVPLPSSWLVCRQAWTYGKAASAQQVAHWSRISHTGILFYSGGIDKANFVMQLHKKPLPFFRSAAPTAKGNPLSGFILARHDEHWGFGWQLMGICQRSLHFVNNRDCSGRIKFGRVDCPKLLLGCTSLLPSFAPLSILFLQQLSPESNVTRFLVRS